MSCQVAVFFLKLYRLCISPLLPSVCRFEPTCSRYASDCFRKFGFIKACWLTVKRLLRCHPWCEGGFDPIP